MKTIIVELEESDFAPVMESPSEEKFFVSLGPSHGFEGKFIAGLGKLRVFGDRSTAWFQTAGGGTWGHVEGISEYRGKLRPEDVMARPGFLSRRFWLNQQICAAEDLGHTDASCGLFFRYGSILRKRFGVPSRLVVEVHHYLEAL